MTQELVSLTIIMAVAAIIMEAAVHFPALSRFNGYDLACQLPLLAAGSEILWVCGEGFAEGLAPDEETAQILQLELENGGTTHEHE